MGPPKDVLQSTCKHSPNGKHSTSGCRSSPGDAAVGLTGNEVVDVLEGLHDGLLGVPVYVSSPLVDDQGADADALTAACIFDVKPYGVGHGTRVADEVQHRCSTGKRQAVNDGLTCIDAQA